MTAAASTLVCSKCGAAPPPGLPAQPGWTHYRSHTRVSGIGQKPFTRLTSCGLYVLRPGSP